MKKKLKIILLSTFYFLFSTAIAFAAFEYKLEVPIRGTEKVTGLASYINFIYIFGIGAVGLAALYALVMGGVKYIVSAAVDVKADAKDQILKALIGLGIALGSYLILNTINPDLVNLREPGVTILKYKIQPATIPPGGQCLKNEDCTEGNECVGAVAKKSGLCQPKPTPGALKRDQPCDKSDDKCDKAAGLKCYRAFGQDDPTCGPRY